MTKIIEFEGDPSLEVLQKAVGGYIQTVPDFNEYNGKPCVVFCDEDGLNKNKEVNVGATAAWRTYLTNEYGATSFDPDMAKLVGDVAIVYGGEE